MGYAGKEEINAARPLLLKVMRGQPVAYLIPRALPPEPRNETSLEIPQNPFSKKPRLPNHFVLQNAVFACRRKKEAIFCCVCGWYCC